MTGCRLIYTFIAICSVALAGCQQSNSLAGAVTYNGEPVKKGSIAFQSADGTGSGFGADIVDGKYKAEKSQPGKHTVLVRGVHESRRASIIKRWDWARVGRLAAPARALDA